MTPVRQHDHDDELLRLAVVPRLDSHFIRRACPLPYCGAGSPRAGQHEVRRQLAGWRVLSIVMHSHFRHRTTSRGAALPATQKQTSIRNKQRWRACGLNPKRNRSQASRRRCFEKQRRAAIPDGSAQSCRARCVADRAQHWLVGVARDDGSDERSCVAEQGRDGRCRGDYRLVAERYEPARTARLKRSREG